MLKTPIKIGLVFLKKDKEEILELLQKKEIIHLIELKKKKEIKEQIIDVQTKIAKIKFALEFLQQFAIEKKGIKEKISQMFSPPFIYLTEEQLKEEIANCDFEKLVQKCENLQSKMSDLEKEKKELEKQKQFYQEWAEFPYNLQELKEIKSLKVFCGQIKDPFKFEAELKKKTNLYELKIISFAQKGKPFKISLFYHLSQEKVVKELLAKFEAKEVKEIENSPPIRKKLKEIEERLNEISQQNQKIWKELKNLLKSFNDLKVLYDYFNWRKRKIEAELESWQTKKLIFLTGWIESSRVKELKEELKKITKNFEIFPIKPGKDEQIPVIIENKKAIAPFELIMRIYGPPKPNEIDPVPWLAPFFIFFFGFCVGDGGYGIILAILSLILIKLLKIPTQQKSLFYLLFYGGLTTLLMGAIFGSWFGVTVEKMKLLDPVKNPLLMLGIAFLLGIFQLIFGIFLRMYSKIRNKMTKEAFLEDFPWIYFIFTILVFGAKNFLAFSTKIANLLLFSGILFVILTHSRKTKNIILKPFVGVISLYGVMSYISDALSYSRLVALGLSTSIVGYVINLTAKVIKEIIPIAGIIVAGIILIVGHLFNIVISVLGAFVHSMRLQFVEFLPKFLEGGGQWFRPFSRESKYVKVI